MGHRRAEHSHHRVADKLLHRPPEPLHLPPQPRVIWADPGPHILRISMIRGSGEPDQITEQDGDRLALLGPPVGLLFEQGAARQAKPRDLRVHLPTRTTHRCHHSSLNPTASKNSDRRAR